MFFLSTRLTSFWDTFGWIGSGITVLAIWFSFSLGFEFFKRGVRAVHPTLIVAGLACIVLVASLMLYALFGPAKSAAKETETASAQTTTKPLTEAPLIKDPKIEWDNDDKVWVTGTYTRSGEKFTAYVTFFSSKAIQYNDHDGEQGAINPAAHERAANRSRYC
jgi:hypothetical protein